VDLTLYDLKTGAELPMTGAYDEMSERSYAAYPGGTSLQRWDRTLLRNALESEGFTVYPYEWWHFDYKDWQQYPILNLTFEQLSHHATDGNGHTIFPDQIVGTIPAGSSGGLGASEKWTHPPTNPHITLVISTNAETRTYHQNCNEGSSFTDGRLNLAADQTATAYCTPTHGIRIYAIYKDKGYTDARVTFKAIPQPDNTAFAEFDVVEGGTVQITDIKFEGNKAFSSRELRSTITTKTYSRLLSWVTGWGALDQKKLQEDVDRLTAYYYDNGYLSVQVQHPRIDRNGNKITVTFVIDEGTPYRVGRINIEGNLKFPRRELRKQLTMKSGELFRGSVLQHQVLALSDFYSNRGYAYVNVDPRTQLIGSTKKVNVTFVVNPGHEVLIDRINISGNTKTADKVIRREIQVQEQEPYSAEQIRDSKVRLDRLGFFSDTRITTSPATQPDKINLDVNVAEANTASFQVAGGFDSYQSLFGNFTLGNTNLFGGGESLILNAQVGFLFQNYSISYTEPWFLDIPLGVGMQLFDNKQYLLSFNQASAGFTLTTTYPLTELGFKKLGPFSLKDVSAGVGYTFQSVGITGLNPFTTFQIARYRGYTQTSEITPTIRRFTVDNPTDPRTGTVESLTMQLGGIGGGNSFIKGVVHGRYFYPFLKSQSLGTFVVSQGITFGIGTNLKSGTGGELPLYERFFPGGVGGPGGPSQLPAGGAGGRPSTLPANSNLYNRPENADRNVQRDSVSTRPAAPRTPRAASR